MTLKFSTTYTDQTGLTSEFHISADPAALRDVCADCDSESTISDLAQTFELALPEMLQAHLQAHHKSSVGLVSASFDLAKKQLSELELSVFPPSTEDKATQKNTPAPAGRKKPAAGDVVGASNPSRSRG